MALPSFDQSIRILAIRASRNQSDWEAQYRRVARWYARTFATPLHEVLEFDESFVLQHYYEDHYAQLDDEEWRQEARDATETPAERAERLAKEAAEDQMLLQAAAADRQRLDKAKGRQQGLSSPDPIDADATVERLKGALAGIPEAIEPGRRGEKVKPLKVRGLESFEVIPGPGPDPDTIEMGVRMPKKPGQS